MSLSTPCGAVVRHFTSDERVLFVPVGDTRVITTLINRDAFLASFASRYSWSLLQERPLSQWLQTRPVMPPPVTIDAVHDVSAAAGLLKNHPSAGGVLVVMGQDGYLGLVTQQAILSGMMAALSEARDAALAASEAKSMFLATMSHEIRTPLNGIIGLSEALLDERIEPSSHELVTLIHHSGLNLLELVNNILDLSRLEVDKLTLDQRPLNLGTLVRELVATLRIHAQRKGLDLRVTILPGTPELVVGDQLRLRQVLTNLIGNAVKFTEHGHVELIVRRDDERMLMFIVSDTGPGMDQRTLRQLFQPFVQGDGSPSRRHEGSGLGLAICQRLVDLMHGTLNVNSQEGRGSSFTLRLPLAEVSPPTLAAAH